jgi:hypothetical protein
LIDAATLLVMIFVIGLHVRVARFSLGSTLEGDEAKHFTSGVMVFDYLRTGLPSNPVRFAEQFEVRYPLVSIGHWPPMYYAVQAVYYFLAGPFVRSAQILSALLAVCLALLIFLSLRRRTGQRIGLLTAGIFLALPLVQTAAWQVMSDLLTGLFVYLAILAFARLLDEPGNWKAAVAFAICAIAAILTKGSAWALGPFVLLAPLLGRRSRFFKSPWFVGSMLMVVLLGSAFYLLARRMGIGYPARLTHYLTEGFGHRLAVLQPLLHCAPVLLIALSIPGALLAMQERWRRDDEARGEARGTTLLLVAGAWIASQLIFLTILPMTPEPRVLLPSLAPATLLTANFLHWLQTRLRQRSWLAGLSPVVLAAAVVANAGAVPLLRIDGYSEAVNAMAYPPDGALILVATNDSTGEPQIITGRLTHDRAHRDVLLRGTHVLAEIDAQGNDTSRFQNASTLRNYLLQMPVRYIVLGSPPYDFAYQSVLDSVMSGNPHDFRLIGKFPFVDQPLGQTGELRVYENPAGRDRHPSVVSTPLGYDAGRRTVEYHWK